MIEKKLVTLEDGLTFATNPNNLLLALKGMSSSEELLSQGGQGNGLNASRKPTNVPRPPARSGSPSSMLDMIE